MSEPDDPVIDRILRETEWLEDHVILQFTHCLLHAPMLDVMSALRDSVPRSLPGVPGLFEEIATGETDDPILIVGRGGETIAWHKQRRLPLFVELSRRLNVRLDWISVYEDLYCRAYRLFLGGACEVLVRDPERYWAQNILDSKDLTGSGERQFQTAKDFLDHVSHWYRPVDVAWTYFKWRDPIMRAEVLASPDVAFNHCVALPSSATVHEVELVGDWPQQCLHDVANICEKLAMRVSRERHDC